MGLSYQIPKTPKVAHAKALCRLQRALESLPPDQREVVVLRLEQELSLEAIGEITGAGRETVKSRLRYAMDKLRARLGGQRDGPEAQAATGSNR